MKYLIILLAVLALSVGSVSAQESSVRGFTGLEYDSDFGFTSVIGSSQRLSGGLSLIERVTVGEYGTLETDIAYFFDFENSKFSIGLTAGPNADFVGTQNDGKAPVVYILGAGGFIIGYTATNVGLHLAGKYKFSFDQDTFYQDGFQGGLYISIPL